MSEAISCHTVDHWKEQLDKAKESNKLVVVDFTASWCPPCRFISPYFVELATKFPNVIFIKIDVDELKPVAQEHNVEAMPTFIFMKDGKEIEKSRIVGADKDKLADRIAKLAAGQPIE